MTVEVGDAVIGDGTTHQASQVLFERIGVHDERDVGECRPVSEQQGPAGRVATGIATEPGTFDAAGYDALSGNRLLMITSTSLGTAASELRIILNWTPVSPSSP